MTSFHKEYKLTYIAEDGNNLELKQTYDQIGLKLDFNITKTITKSKNVGTIGITNASRDTAATFQKPGYIILELGYKGDTAIVMSGQKETISSTSDFGSNRIEMTCLEGSGTYSQSHFSQAYPAGVTVFQIINDLVKTITQKIASVQSADIFNLGADGFKIYNHPQLVDGDVFELLENFLKPFGYIYFINKGVLTILDNSRGFKNLLAIQLNTSNGLIGSPYPTAQADPAKKSRAGVQCESALNYNFDVGRLLILNSEFFTNATFRMETVVFYGDSFDGPWNNNLTAYELNNGI
jgi:hypothetical protein